MPTTPILHEKVLGGMNSSLRSWAPSNEQWRLLYNIATINDQLRQFPQKVVKMSLSGAATSENILALFNFPVNYLDNGITVALTPTKAYRVGAAIFKALVDQNLAAVTFVSDDKYRRWSTYKHNDHVFFTNELNPVRYTEGTHVRTIGTNVPAGRYVGIFYDHLIIGAPVVGGTSMPNHVMWSHLHRYDNMTPSTSSEADSYICSEFQTGEERATGITGMQIIKDLCLIFTENTIYAMQYVGLPKVVRVSPLHQDYGNGLPYAVTALNDTVAFIDTNQLDFYAIDGINPPQAFGGPVKNYFFTDLSTKIEYAARTYAYRDRERQEVTWVYVSGANTTGANAGKFDKAVVYNWETKSWAVRTIENVHSVCKCGSRARQFDELTGPTNTVATPYTLNADTIVDTGERTDRIFGTSVAQILAEVAPTTADASLITQDTPVLETGDFFYGSTRDVKEVRDILLHCSGTNLASVKVEISTRARVDDTVIFVVVGYWTPLLFNELLTFAPVRGKIIRYRFTPVPTTGKMVRDFVFNMYEESVYSVKAEK